MESAERGCPSRSRVASQTASGLAEAHHSLNIAVAGDGHTPAGFISTGQTTLAGAKSKL
jgi:hypothetical protein